MKHSNEKNNRQEPIYLLIGGVVIVVFIILYCMVVWSVTHRKGNDIVISSSSSVVTEEIASSTESTTSVDVVAPVESSVEEEVVEEPGLLDGVDYNDTSNDMGLTFEPVEDVVTAKDVTNLRSEPSTAQGKATVLTQLRNGETAIRIGREDTTGWSKIVYDGQIMYASTNYLIVVEETE